MSFEQTLEFNVGDIVRTSTNDEYTNLLAKVTRVSRNYEGRVIDYMVRILSETNLATNNVVFFASELSFAKVLNKRLTN